MTACHSKEKAEQQQTRLARNQELMAAHCSQEVSVQADLDTRWARNQESMANHRSEETAEQVRERDLQRTADGRSEETPEQSDAQRARDQEQEASRRAGKRVVSLDADLGGFGDWSVVNSRTWKNLGCSCDHAHDYVNHRSLDLDLDLRRMTLCKVCKVLKWRVERPGLCCLSRKIAIPDVPEPPRPLKNLLSGQLIAWSANARATQGWQAR